MHKFKTAFILAFIVLIELLGACSPAGNRNHNTSIGNSNTADVSVNAVKDNVEELGMLVRLPFEPEEATWKESSADIPNSEQIPSQNPRKLTAVLRFSAENAKNIVDQSERIKAGKAAVFATERWFPAELIAQSELNGDDTLKGKSYSAADFLLPPYTDGKITQVENSDFFVLEIYSR